MTTLRRFVRGPLKVAVCSMGPFKVMTAGLFVPEKEPLPLPTQPPKLSSAGGVALIERLVPASYQPLSGLIAPELVALMARLVSVTVVFVELIARKYWSLKLAVMFVSAKAAALWNKPPPSLQEVQVYWALVPALCVRAPRVWKEPAGHWKVIGVALVVPSTKRSMPGGTVSSVTFTTE